MRPRLSDRAFLGDAHLSHIEHAILAKFRLWLPRIVYDVPSAGGIRRANSPTRPDQVIQEGKVLNQRYRLVRPLGAGSQATVWIAEHLALGSQVAVKLIDPELAKQEDARERFKREATAAAKLRSAHVVQILDHGIDGDQPFIVMELLDGEDLFSRLEKRERLTLQETSMIVTQVARALMRAHASGIIHRDLKPENVFIAPNEDEEIAKVLDFGVAKVSSPAKSTMSKTGAGTLIGTPHYMSPEQVKGIGEIDHRSDLWALAVIAYQMATGELPFDSEGVGDLLIKISMNTPRAPSELVWDLPASFDEWFAKAIAKNPANRYQTARELAEALARSAGIEPKPSVTRSGMAGVDLDWGPSEAKSYAGIPASANSVDSPRSSAKQPANKPTAKPAEEEVEVIDIISVPPAAEHVAAPAAPARATPPKPPPPRSSEARAPEPRPSTAKTKADAGAVPLWDLPKGASTETAKPASSATHSTVTGLSASPSIIPPPELDGTRRRKAVWFVAMALVLGGGFLAVTVVRSRLAEEPVNATTPAQPATTSASGSIQDPPLAPSDVTPVGSTVQAVDPSVTKKPTGSATPSASAAKPGVRLPQGVVKRPDGEIEIWLPLPEKENKR